MNVFEESIQKNEAKEFILGRGEYFVRDRDWGGHDSTYTYSVIIQYLAKDENSRYKILENELIKVLLDDSLLSDDLMQIIGIVWNYFVYKNEGVLKQEWIISNQLKTEVSLQFERLQKLNLDIRNIATRLNIMKERYNFDLLNLDIS